MIGLNHIYLTFSAIFCSFCGVLCVTIILEETPVTKARLSSKNKGSLLTGPSSSLKKCTSASNYRAVRNYNVCNTHCQRCAIHFHMAHFLALHKSQDIIQTQINTLLWDNPSLGNKCLTCITSLQSLLYTLSSLIMCKLKEKARHVTRELNLNDAYTALVLLACKCLAHMYIFHLSHTCIFTKNVSQAKICQPTRKFYDLIFVGSQGIQNFTDWSAEIHGNAYKYSFPSISLYLSFCSLSKQIRYHKVYIFWGVTRIWKQVFSCFAYFSMIYNWL